MGMGEQYFAAHLPFIGQNNPLKTNSY